MMAFESDAATGFEEFLFVIGFLFLLSSSS